MDESRERSPLNLPDLESNQLPTTATSSSARILSTGAAAVGTATSDVSSPSAATSSSPSCSEPATLLQYEQQLLTWLQRFSDELANRITTIDGRIDGLLSDATRVDSKLRVAEAKLQCAPVIRGAVHSRASHTQGELSGRAGMSTAGISIAQKKQNENQKEKQKEEQKEKQKEKQKEEQKEKQKEKQKDRQKGGKRGGGLSFEERVQVNYQVALQLGFQALEGIREEGEREEQRKQLGRGRAAGGSSASAAAVAARGVTAGEAAGAAAGVAAGVAAAGIAAAAGAGDGFSARQQQQLGQQQEAGQEQQQQQEGQVTVVPEDTWSDSDEGDDHESIDSDRSGGSSDSIEGDTGSMESGFASSEGGRAAGSQASSLRKARGMDTCRGFYQAADASQSYYSPQLTSAAAAAAAAAAGAAAAGGGAAFGGAAVGAASPLFPPYSSQAAVVSPFPDRPDSLAALASLYDFTTAIPTPSSPPPYSEPGDLPAGLARQHPAPAETPEASASVAGHLAGDQLVLPGVWSGEFPGGSGTFPGAVPVLPGTSPSPPPFPSPSLSLMEPSGWAVDNFRSLLEQALKAPGGDSI
ncbi:unnamed protein product [Closterium sp. NIES-65]|nr:unnamed protein product [Closterium sp. NIES-65]